MSSFSGNTRHAGFNGNSLSSFGPPQPVTAGASPFSARSGLSSFGSPQPVPAGASPFSARPRLSPFGPPQPMTAGASSSFAARPPRPSQQHGVQLRPSMTAPYFRPGSFASQHQARHSASGAALRPPRPPRGPFGRPILPTQTSSVAVYSSSPAVISNVIVLNGGHSQLRNQTQLTRIRLALQEVVLLLRQIAEIQDRAVNEGLSPSQAVPSAHWLQNNVLHMQRMLQRFGHAQDPRATYRHQLIVQLAQQALDALLTIQAGPHQQQGNGAGNEGGGNAPDGTSVDMDCMAEE